MLQPPFSNSRDCRNIGRGFFYCLRSGRFRRAFLSKRQGDDLPACVGASGVGQLKCTP